MKMIQPTHPLLPIAKKCISDTQYERPTAEELCQRLEILQEGVEYKLNLLPTDIDEKDVTELERQNKLLQKKLEQYDQKLKENDNIIRDMKQSNESVLEQLEDLQQQRGNPNKQGKMKSNQRWIPGRNLAKEMVRGQVAMDGDVAYFMNKDGTLYKYDSTVDPYEAWSQLVKCPYEDSSLAVVDGLVTAIGGVEFRGLGKRVTNRLISLKGREIRSWESHFPDMPTSRYCAVAVTTSKHLIVIGGIRIAGVANSLEATDKVEVMNTAAAPLTWSTVAKLIKPYCKISATPCGNQLYILGGDKGRGSKIVMACSLSSLVQSSKDTEPSAIWRQPTAVPNFYSTCASINGELLAVGGTSDTNLKNSEAQTQLYRYDQNEGSWNLFTNMITPRYNSLVAVFPSKNLIVVVGGYDKNKSCDITELCYMS